MPDEEQVPEQNEEEIRPEPGGDGLEELPPGHGEGSGEEGGGTISAGDPDAPDGGGA